MFLSRRDLDRLPPDVRSAAHLCDPTKGRRTHFRLSRCWQHLQCSTCWRPMPECSTRQPHHWGPRKPSKPTPCVTADALFTLARCAPPVPTNFAAKVAYEQITVLLELFPVWCFVLRNALRLLSVCQLWQVNACISAHVRTRCPPGPEPRLSQVAHNLTAMMSVLLAILMTIRHHTFSAPYMLADDAHSFTVRARLCFGRCSVDLPCFHGAHTTHDVQLPCLLSFG